MGVGLPGALFCMSGAIGDERLEPPVEEAITGALMERSASEGGAGGAASKKSIGGEGDGLLSFEMTSDEFAEEANANEMPGSLTSAAAIPAAIPAAKCSFKDRKDRTLIFLCRIITGTVSWLGRRTFGDGGFEPCSLSLSVLTLESQLLSSVSLFPLAGE